MDTEGYLIRDSGRDVRAEEATARGFTATTADYGDLYR